jgi:hypothetical protein
MESASTAEEIVKPEGRPAEERTKLPLPLAPAPLLAKGLTGAEAGETCRGDGAGEPTADLRAKGLELDWREGDAEEDPEGESVRPELKEIRQEKGGRWEGYPEWSAEGALLAAAPPPL